MKELSIKEKAKAYDLAIEAARCIYNNMKEGSNFSGMEDLEVIFPELAESEDEKIRKALICHYQGDGCLCTNEYRIDYKEIRAWLEKQDKPTEINPSEFDLHLNKLLKQFESLPKDDIASSLNFYLNVVQNNGTYKKEKRVEQKPFDYENVNIHQNDFAPKSAMEAIKEKNVDNANKAEPKFKVGDWVVRDNTTAQILDIQEQYYIGLDIDGDDFTSSKFLSDDKIHLWTIQDAKPGDVICDYYEAYDNPLIFILKKFEHVDFGLVRPSDYSSYCFLTAGDIQMFKEGTYHHEHYIQPATKEQCDLLFTKMKEAGYTFDFEKKELKRIIDEKQIKKNLQDNSFRRMFEQNPAWSEDDERMYIGLHNLIYVVHDCNCDSKEKLEFSDWLKSLKDRVQPKQEWNEEDEKIFKIIIDGFEDYNSPEADWWKGLKVKECIKWIKSLKNRMQSKQEWSEENERERKHCIDFLNHPDWIKATPTIVDNCKNWLKSLRPQNRWKPSDEQMNAFDAILVYNPPCSNECRNHLITLYNELKKLRKE